MEITIEVKGYGNEIVIGTIAKDEAKQINDYVVEHDMVDFGQFYSSDGHDELGFTSWWEKDDLRHAYGPNDESAIIIKDENDDILFDDAIENLSNETPLYRVEVEKFKGNLNDEILFGRATEEGVWYVTIEVDDNEGFNIEKLGIVKRIFEVYSGDNEYVGDGVVFDKITYDGNEYELELDSSYTEDLYVDVSNY